jgi:DNA-binding protein H-NS
MTIKLNLITDEKIELLELMIEKIKEKLPPGSKIVTISYADARNVSIGYRAELDIIAAEEMDHEVLVVDGICQLSEELQRRAIRDRHMKLVDKPSASLSKHRETWQEKGRTPWRKRR